MSADVCICEPEFCFGEGYDDGDPRTCHHCAALDGEWPCPADAEFAVEVLTEANALLAGKCSYCGSPEHGWCDR